MSEKINEKQIFLNEELDFSEISTFDTKLTHYRPRKP